MVTLIYSSNDVGPVCARVVAKAKDLTATKDTELPTSVKGVLVRWGSRWHGVADVEINSAESVRIARDKRESRKILVDLCPETWLRSDDVETPCVIRPRRHHGGAKFYVCRSGSDVRSAIRACGLGWYGSELITKTREFRVFILQGRVVCVSERFPAKKTDVAWNLAMGGRLINIARAGWDTKAVVAAIRATKLIGLDWGAVDVAIDENGKPIVFEVNTAPGLRNPYTIHQIAKALRWIGNNSRTKIAEVGGKQWRDLIHPALVKE